MGSGSLCLVGEVREAKPEKSGDKLNLMNERMKKRSGVVDTDLSGIELLCRVRTEFIRIRSEFGSVLSIVHRKIVLKVEEKKHEEFILLLFS